MDTLQRGILMATTVKKLMDWLTTLEESDTVGINSGGLTLVLVTEEADWNSDPDGPYFEVGGWGSEEEK